IRLSCLERHNEACDAGPGGWPVWSSRELCVPEPLSGLLTELIDVGRSHLGVGSPATSPWLFPGHLPRRPITASRLGERLRLLGIRALPGRRATLLQLAAEVPAAVLAETPAPVSYTHLRAHET